MVALFRQVCRPLATPETPGAFLCGLRLLAIDGTTEDVPDTPANVAAFGRHHGGRGPSAYPQVQAVYLTECGTHAIVDAGFWPGATSETVGARRLLRSVEAGMLVLVDRGLYAYDFVAAVRARQAHVLARLPANVQPKPVRTLPDGTVLAWIYPAARSRRQRERQFVRLIEYTLTDPALPRAGERYRLVTTLLDARTYPACDLACGYHERWEIELTIDEVASHQRLAGRTLRRLKPVGVIQELSGLLLAHYCVRRLMDEAAQEAAIDPDRLSFVQALRVLQDALPEFQLVAPEHWPALAARLRHDLAAQRLPERRPRSNPRVVKRKMSPFRLKRATEPASRLTARSWRQLVALAADTSPLWPPDSLAATPSRHELALTRI